MTPTDPGTLASLHHAHARAVARLCRSYEADPQRASEVEQEVWLAVWRALPSFRGDATLRTWLLRIAHHVCVRHVVRGGRSPAWVPLEDLPDAAAAPDEAADRERARARLRATIAMLRPVDRTLVLAWLEGLDTRELAELTGLSPTHVTTKLHRLRRALAREEP